MVVLNVERLVVWFLVWLEFARAIVYRDVEEGSFDHVGFSSYLKAVLLEGFKHIFFLNHSVPGPNMLRWIARLSSFLKCLGVAGYFVRKLM